VKEKVYTINNVVPTQGENKPWELRVVNSKKLNPIQKAFGHLFYWAGFYDERRTINFFLTELGISPFLKLYQC
jgi:hypothetical protein